MTNSSVPSSTIKLLRLNWKTKWCIPRRMGYPYWSLSAYLKHKTKSAVNFISAFEETLAKEAKKRQLDGIICGHIHHAEIREIDGILYCNDGDWVESCTALVEEWDGSLQVVRWVMGENKGSIPAPSTLVNL